MECDDFWVGRMYHMVSHFSLTEFNEVNQQAPRAIPILSKELRTAYGTMPKAHYFTQNAYAKQWHIMKAKQIYAL